MRRIECGSTAPAPPAAVSTSERRATTAGIADKSTATVTSLPLAASRTLCLPVSQCHVAYAAHSTAHCAPLPAAACSIDDVRVCVRSNSSDAVLSERRLTQFSLTISVRPACAASFAVVAMTGAADFVAPSSLCSVESRRVPAAARAHAPLHCRRPRHLLRVT